MKGRNGSKIVAIDRCVKSFLNHRNSSVSVSFRAPAICMEMNKENRE